MASVRLVIVVIWIFLHLQFNDWVFYHLSLFRLVYAHLSSHFSQQQQRPFHFVQTAGCGSQVSVGSWVKKGMLGGFSSVYLHEWNAWFCICISPCFAFRFQFVCPLWKKLLLLEIQFSSLSRVLVSGKDLNWTGDILIILLLSTCPLFVLAAFAPLNTLPHICTYQNQHSSCWVLLAPHLNPSHWSDSETHIVIFSQ